MKIPDLVGIKYEEAQETIEFLRNSFNVIVRETISPFSNNEINKNECRVVRQQNYDNTIIITVSYF